MVKYRYRVNLVTVIVAAALVILGTVGVSLTARSAEIDTFRDVFYSDTAPEEHPFNNSGNVLDAEAETDRVLLPLAPANVRGNVLSIESANWFRQESHRHMYDEVANSGDPVYLWQTIFHLWQTAPKAFGFLENLIPQEYQSLDQYEAGVFWLMENPAEHRKIAYKIMAVLDGAEVSMRELGSYTSMVYQEPGGTELPQKFVGKLNRSTIPRPIFKNTQGVGGHELVFLLRKTDEKALLRAECFQWMLEKEYKIITPEPEGTVTVTEDPVEDGSTGTVTVTEDDKKPGGGGGGGSSKLTPKDSSQSSEENPVVSDEAKPSEKNTNNTVSYEDGNALDNSNPNGYQPSEKDNRETQAAAETQAESQHGQAEQEYRDKTGGGTTTAEDDSVVVDEGTYGPINDGSNQDATPASPPAAPPSTTAPPAEPAPASPKGDQGEDLSGDWF